MTDTNPAAPGNGFDAPVGFGAAPDPLAPQPGQPGSGRPKRPHYIGVMRIVVGIVWAVIAIGVGAGGVAELTIGNVGGAIVCFVIAVLSAWYDYRVWARRARRLIL